MAESHIDRTQEFNDYALAMVSLKGGDLALLSERLGVPLDSLERRLREVPFQKIQRRVAGTQLASAICRVKVRERSVELVERMMEIALGERKARPSEVRMLIALRDAVLPTDLHKAVERAADAVAETHRTLSTSLSSHVENLRNLTPPKRTLDTPLLSGKDALPVAARLNEDERGG